MAAPRLSEIPTIAFFRRHGWDKVADQIEHAIETRPEVEWILTHPKTAATIGFVAGCAVGLLLLGSPDQAEKIVCDIGCGIGGSLGLRYGIPATGVLLDFIDLYTPWSAPSPKI